MLIQPHALQHWIDHFFGYGSWNSKIWFIGYEEGGGEQPEEVAQKFNYFYDKHRSARIATLCDIRELYQHVPIELDGSKTSNYKTLFEYRFDKRSALHGSWKNLIAFVHGYRGKKLPDLLSYQKDFFASRSSHEALIQLYPLPSPHNHAWYYAWLNMPEFGFLKSRTLYQQHVYQHRIKSILNNIKTHRPEVVIMYGMDNINVLKESVQEIFPAAKFKMIKAVKLQTPQHHIAELNTTRLVITTQIPTLRHNRVESGFDWEYFGKMVGVES
ncbi:MAG: hypothetical protein ABI477_04130 [Chryseolinea sp.]